MLGTILLVDDDKELLELLAQYLEEEGCEVMTACDSEDAVQKALHPSIDAIVLDVMLPQKNGFEVLKIIREHSQVPVLMLTARGDDIDRIVGLEIGADDYLPKPCNPRELLARLRAILRRTQKASPSSLTFEHQHMLLDCSTRIVTYKNTPLDLTNTEFNILEVFIKSPGQAFSKEELTEYSLGRKYTSHDRSIDVHISNLRNKLEESSNGKLRIRTIRGFGYMLHA